MIKASYVNTERIASVDDECETVKVIHRSLLPRN